MSQVALDAGFSIFLLDSAELKNLKLDFRNLLLYSLIFRFNDDKARAPLL